MSRSLERVLLVETDPDDAHRILSALGAAEGPGPQVTHVPDWRDALELLEGGDLDAMVLGCATEAEALSELAALAAAGLHPPVLVLTRVAPEEGEGARSRLRDGGAWDHLPKSCIAVGSLPLLLRSLQHVLDRKRLLEELEHARRVGLHLAHHDTLTDLPNRQLFRTRLRQLIAQARRHPRTIAVLFLDLDRFKKINDTLGHAFGDRLLQSVARRIEGCIRESDTAARRGGDEFTVILDGVRRGQDAAKVAKKVLDSLSRPYVIDDHELFAGASIGISLFPSDGEDVDTLVKHADIAMYRAKARGGNNYQFFLPEMNEKALERMELESSLHQAVERSQFVLHYQPLVDVRTGRIVCMEALVRWQHPALGLIYPDEFIPVAEESGLILALGDWVLHEACRQNRTWQEEGLTPLPVAVNFSARQFHHQRPVARVRACLRKTGLEARFLDLELTESTVMQDVAQAVDTLKRMRALGVKVTIDDFGKGHSSLGYLKRFPISKLKIDKDFVRTLLVDPKDAAITEAIVAMARSLRVRSVAEGVETGEHLDFLRRRGCDEIQGYLLSPPLEATGARAILASPRLLEPAELAE